MKKTLIALALSGLAISAVAADAPKDAPKEPEPDYTLTGNFGVFSDYRFRGISQTRLAPAAQGGFDFAHKSGFYLGNWNSNVSSDVYWHGAGLEMDFYGGYKTEIGSLGIDFGTLYYYYPGADIRTSSTAKLGKYDNNEIYLGLTYGPFSLKSSYALTNYFGLKGTTDGALGAPNKSSTTNSKGTTYVDLTFSKEIAEKISVSAHAGSTSIKNYSTLSYADYRVGISRDINGWVIGLNYFTNNLKSDGKSFNTNSGVDTYADSKKLYKSAAVISLTKTF